jgi:hypothetical protein
MLDVDRSVVEDLHFEIGKVAFFSAEGAVGFNWVIGGFQKTDPGFATAR